MTSVDSRARRPARLRSGAKTGLRRSSGSRSRRIRRCRPPAWPAFPSQLRLTTLRGEPVYRITDRKRRLVVSAVDGRRLGAISAAQATDAVRRLLPGHELGPVRTLVRKFRPRRWSPLRRRSSSVSRGCGGPPSIDSPPSLA